MYWHQLKSKESIREIFRQVSGTATCKRSGTPPRLFPPTESPPNNTGTLTAHSAMPDSATPGSTRSLYFGYGSNIWIDQMNRRCPENKYVGVALLKDW